MDYLSISLFFLMMVFTRHTNTYTKKIELPTFSNTYKTLIAKYLKDYIDIFN